MKKLTALTLLYFITSMSCYSQGEIKESFAFPIEFGQGFLRGPDFNHYLLSFSAAPMLSIQINTMNKLRIGPAVNLYSTNPGSDWSYGIRIGYRLNKTGSFGNLYSLWLYPEFTHSKEKRNLVGLGLVAAFKPLEISVQPQFEMESEKFWLSSKIGLNIAVFFKKKKTDPINDL